MELGLNKHELDSLLSFGTTEEEIENELAEFADETGYFSQISMLRAVTDKISLGISENNKRITEQLLALGIKLS